MPSFEAALVDPRIDAVLLCLPHHLHAEAIHRAVVAGKHVLVEKPLALTIEDAERLLREADSAGLCLAVAEQYRLSPLVTRAKQIIAPGLLGRVILVHAGAARVHHPSQPWKRARDSMGGGVLMDVGVHYVDVLRFWFGEPDLVWAATPPHSASEMEGEDSAFIALRFPGGPLVSLHLSWAGFRAPESPNFEVIGERGSLSLWFRSATLHVAAPLPPDHWSRRLRGLLPWSLERTMQGLLPKARHTRIRVAGRDLIGSRALVEDFLRAITTGAPPAVSAQEGLEDLKVVLAAYESLRSGAPVALADH